jgi:hypothetical protein
VACLASRRGGGEPSVAQISRWPSPANLGTDVGLRAGGSLGRLAGTSSMTLATIDVSDARGHRGGRRREVSWREREGRVSYQFTRPTEHKMSP